MTRALEAKFLVSATGIDDAPSFGGTEVAFLGRSNVGKSTLINALCGQKSLAKSSSRPGKTQLINFFGVNFERFGEANLAQKFSLIFVDLPGFGYAKVSKQTKEIWQKKLDNFLRLRAEIRLFIHLVDSRQYNMQIDANLDEFMQTFLRPDQSLIRFYTKSDKLNQKERASVMKFDPKAVLISAQNAKSIELARDIIIKEAFGC